MDDDDDFDDFEEAPYETGPSDSDPPTQSEPAPEQPVALVHTDFDLSALSSPQIASLSVSGGLSSLTNPP